MRIFELFATVLRPIGQTARRIGVTTDTDKVANVPFIDLSIPRRGCGIIWVNSSHENQKYIREAERSAKTMRTFVDNSEYVLVSDDIKESLDPVFDFQSVVPFHVPACLKDKVHFNGQMTAKHSVLKHMTWEKNLYLGSDIAALRPEAEGLFNLLDNFDIVVAHAPTRIYSQGERDENLLGLPECFPEMNCDLIAYRRSKAVGEFLSEWQRVYSTNAIDHPHDQGAFRYLIFKSKLRFYIVPPEYNYRGFDAPSHVIISQRREAIPKYAKEYRHIAEIYEA